MLSILVWSKVEDKFRRFSLGCIVQSLLFCLCRLEKVEMEDQRDNRGGQKARTGNP